MSRMAMTIVVLCAVSGQTTFAQEPATDGNWLLEWCTPALQVADGESVSPTRREMGSACMGYLMGIMQTTTMYNSNSSAGTRTTLFCPPTQGIMNTQAARIVVQYLRKHPAVLHSQAILLANTAFRDAFPCP
jgi:Rap1a immunity proteins